MGSGAIWRAFEIAARLGLESLSRPRGRPRKLPTDGLVIAFATPKNGS